MILINAGPLILRTLGMFSCLKIDFWKQSQFWKYPPLAPLLPLNLNPLPVREKEI